MQTVKQNSRVLLDTFAGTIQQFFSSRVSPIEDVEDLTQDVCCAIIESYDRFTGGSSPSTWVYAICKNHLFKYYRKKRRSHETIARLIDLYPLAIEHDVRILEGVRDRLPSRQQTLFTDFYRNRKSIREIAAQMNKPEGTIKYLLHVLRRDIRRLALSAVVIQNLYTNSAAKIG